jgi:hypothetical protein
MAEFETLQALGISRQNLLRQLKKVRRLVRMRAAKAPYLESSSEMVAAFRAPESFVAKLWKDLQGEKLQHRPARAQRVILDKPRVLLKLSLADALVHATVAEHLSARAEAFWSDQLHSYRKGRSNLTAVRALAKFLKAHPGTDLYALRSDVESFGDHVRLDDGSPVWGECEKLFQLHGETMHAFRALVSPEIQPGSVEKLPKLPTGSALNPLLTNAVLRPLDTLGEAYFENGQSPGIYLRYGDDFTFVSADPEQADQFRREAEHLLAERGLRMKMQKTRQLYFTRGGIPSRDPRFQPAQELDFLGFRVHRVGKARLKSTSRTELLQDFRRRLERWALSEPSPATPHETCAYTTKILDPQFNSRVAATLARMPDRALLRELDAELMLKTAELLSLKRGRRAFRKFSPRQLIALGWRGLVHFRNSSR